MERDEIRTYKIDDTKITNDNNRCFKVFYTLERKDGNISYCLENFNGDSLNINEMNGYEHMLLNMCFSNFYNKKEIPKEYQNLISIEKEPRTIKDGKNMRYELYKDLCYSRGTSPSGLGYIFTINKWVKDFEEDMKQSAISNSNVFDDYIEYKVLSEIAKKFASEKNSYGELETTMSYYLGKYNIKDFKHNKILDTSMYNRIKNVYDRELHKKIIYRYDEMLEKVPEQYKSKYRYILDFDGDKSDFENFYNIDKKLVILESIEKLENLDSKVKVLVYWSEDNEFGTATAGTNGDDPKVYTIKEMDNLVNIVYERNKKYDCGYIKTKFSIIVDDGKDAILSVTDRIDIGDPCTDTFTNFMKRYYGKEYIESLSKFDNYLESKFRLQGNDEKAKREELLKDWKWLDFDDCSGCFNSPSGKSYFCYDSKTKEYRISSNENWKNMPERFLENFDEFIEYAENYVVNNFLENQNEESEEL